MINLQCKTKQVIRAYFNNKDKMYKFSQSCKSQSKIKKPCETQQICLDFKINQPQGEKGSVQKTSTFYYPKQKPKNSSQKTFNIESIGQTCKLSPTNQKQYISFKINRSAKLQAKQPQKSNHKISPVKPHYPLSNQSHQVKQQNPKYQKSISYNKNNLCQLQKNLNQTIRHKKTDFEEQQSINPFKKNSYLKKTYLNSRNSLEKQNHNQLQICKHSVTKQASNKKIRCQKQLKIQIPTHKVNSITFSQSSHKIISPKQFDNSFYKQDQQQCQGYLEPDVKFKTDANFNIQDSVINDNFEQYDIFTPCKNLQQQFERQQRMYIQELQAQKLQNNQCKQIQLYFLNQFDSFSHANNMGRDRQFSLKDITSQSNNKQSQKNDRKDYTVNRQDHTIDRNKNSFNRQEQQSGTKRQNHQNNCRQEYNKQLQQSITTVKNSNKKQFFFLTNPPRTSQKKSHNNNQSKIKIVDQNYQENHEISKFNALKQSKDQKKKRSNNYQDLYQNNQHKQQITRQRHLIGNQMNQAFDQQIKKQGVKQFCFSLSSINLNQDEIHKNLFSNSNQNINYFNNDFFQNIKHQQTLTSKKFHVKQLVQQFISQLQYLDDGSLNEKVVNQLQDVLQSIVFKQSKAKKQSIEQNFNDIQNRNKNYNNIAQNIAQRNQFAIQQDAYTKKLLEKYDKNTQINQNRHDFNDYLRNRPNKKQQNPVINSQYKVSKWHKPSYGERKSPQNVLTQRKQYDNTQKPSIVQQGKYQFQKNYPDFKKQENPYQNKMLLQTKNKLNYTQSLSHQNIAHNKSNYCQSTTGQKPSNSMTVYKPNFSQTKAIRPKQRDIQKQKQNIKVHKNVSFRQNSKKLSFSPLSINPKSSIYVNNKKSTSRRQNLKTQISKQKQWRVY